MKETDKHNIAPITPPFCSSSLFILSFDHSIHYISLNILDIQKGEITAGVGGLAVFKITFLPFGLIKNHLISNKQSSYLSLQ